MNNAAVDICKYLCKFLFLSYRYPGVELLGHMINLCLTFKETELFSEVAVPFYIPTSSVSGFFSYLFSRQHLLSVFILANLVDTKCGLIEALNFLSIYS